MNLISNLIDKWQSWHERRAREHGAKWALYKLMQGETAESVLWQLDIEAVCQTDAFDGGARDAVSWFEARMRQQAAEASRRFVQQSRWSLPALSCSPLAKALDKIDNETTKFVKVLRIKDGAPAVVYRNKHGVCCVVLEDGSGKVYRGCSLTWVVARFNLPD